MTLLQRAVQRVMAEKQAAQSRPGVNPFLDRVRQRLFPNKRVQPQASTQPPLFENRPTLPEGPEGGEGFVRPLPQKNQQPLPGVEEIEEPIIYGLPD